MVCNISYYFVLLGSVEGSISTGYLFVEREPGLGAVYVAKDPRYVSGNWVSLSHEDLFLVE